MKMVASRKSVSAVLAAATLAVASTPAEAFVAPTSISTGSGAGAPLHMGKSSVTPGPSKSGPSGPAVSEYRNKKMSDRMKKRKKGGLGDAGEVDTSDVRARAGRPVMEVELEPEPDAEGKVEVAPLGGYAPDGTAPPLRLLDLGPVPEDDEAYFLNEKLGVTVHNFWLSAAADGGRIEKTRLEVLKQSARNANFPGFRKGQIPPYAQPKMTHFAFQEEMVRACLDAVKVFGVNEINEDSYGTVTFRENLQKVAGQYDTKKFPTVPFTATFRAVYAPAEEEEEGVEAAAQEAEE